MTTTNKSAVAKRAELDSAAAVVARKRVKAEKVATIESTRSGTPTPSFQMRSPDGTPAFVTTTSQQEIDNKIAGWEAKAKENAYSVEGMLAEMIADDKVKSVEVLEVNEVAEAISEAPAVKAERKPSTKANSGHAYAILGAYRTAKRGGFDVMGAMRDEVASIPAAIRGAAVKLAMKHDDPNGASQEFLKALHAEQPTAAAATAGVRKVSGTVGEKVLKVWHAKTGTSATVSMSLGSTALGSCETVTMRVSADGKTITITAN